MLVDPHNQLLYPFQNQANDYSGQARHGTVNGSGVYATKPNGGRCLYFDGVGDFVTTPSFELSGTVVVFAADVRCKLKATDLQVILGMEVSNKGNFAAYRPTNANSLNWGYWNGSTFVDAIANDFFAAPYNDAWLHMLIACDYAGKNTYFWKDGIPFGAPVAMSGTPDFPSTNQAKYIGSYTWSQFLLTAGDLANVYLGTLPSCPSVAELTANANRLMLGLHPIWSV
jgi:hypothetical protein